MECTVWNPNRTALKQSFYNDNASSNDETVYDKTVYDETVYDGAFMGPHHRPARANTRRAARTIGISTILPSISNAPVPAA